MNDQDIFGSMEKTYNDNITTVLNQIPSDNIAIYIAIFIILLFISKFINFNLSNLFFIIIAFCIIYYIYSKHQINLSPTTDIQTKIELIMPNPTRLGPAYADLVNFLYNVREYYFINPTEFAELVLNIDNFIQLYEEIMSDHVIYCGENIEVAANFCRSAQNNLQSVIFGLSTNFLPTKRFHEALELFDSIMNKYTKQMVTKCNKRFVPGQINNSSKFYDMYGPKPINYFNQYEMY